MDDLKDRARALLHTIEQAFADVNRIGGVSLHEADVIDHYGSDEERAEARKLDPDRRWQDVPDEQVLRMDWCLSFFDPIGFRYYLPAYMSASVRQWLRDGESNFFPIVFHLTVS